MKRATAVDALCAILLFFFLYTALDSLFNLGSLRNLLAFYTKNTIASASVLISMELIISVLIYMRGTRLIGLVIGAAALIFTATVIIRYGGYPHDFGGIFYYLNDKKKLLLIGLLLTVSLSSIALLVIQKKKRKESQEEVYEPVFT
jgi:hypothetical protein